jgi:hypothetical protein
MKLPPRQSGHRISNRISNKPETMNTDTPETDGEWNRLACQDHPEFERNLADFARKLERERDEARATCSELVTDSDAITLARTVVRITQERDEARETSWFSNGIEYRKRNDYIEARNNLNPNWVVVDSQTNQKP